MSDDPKTVNFDVKEFAESGLLWACNQFILWPLGMALRVTYRTEFSDDRAKDDAKWVAAGGKADDSPGTYIQSLGVQEWHWQDGHKETIESESTFEIQGKRIDRWDAFKEFIADRLLEMPGIERDAAANRLASIGVETTIDRRVW